MCITFSTSFVIKFLIPLQIRLSLCGISFVCILDGAENMKIGKIGLQIMTPKTKIKTMKAERKRSQRERMTEAKKKTHSDIEKCRDKVRERES